ncbi:MAG: glucose-1-phosphate cytidylyltransferase [Chitinispirillales bacterium]|jgi:glucose-1-phosphate cytidylyltransferase|nr:glucose-1-phosphate cytidylyltransferase [Chitinispirillales bacterium]
MKVAILAGGLGTRLSEETELRPKPMVEIGGKPILWHIMKIYSHYGFNEFVILTGYKSHVIKDFFINYYARYSDVTVDMANNSVEYSNVRAEPWRVTMLYTGADTMTGGRLLRARELLGGERFLLTYGDGVSDVDINEVVRSHEAAGKAVTLTAVRPTGRFGTITISGDGVVKSFCEKQDSAGVWINGGFFVMEPAIFGYLTDGDATVLERGPFERLVEDGQLNAHKHGGFWRPMDTLHDKNELTGMWVKGVAPWALWEKR